MERPFTTSGDDAQTAEQPPTPGPEIQPVKSNERIVPANGVELCVQTFGDPADSPILLIAGAVCSWTGRRKASASGWGTSKGGIKAHRSRNLGAAAKVLEQWSRICLRRYQ